MIYGFPWNDSCSGRGKPISPVIWYKTKISEDDVVDRSTQILRIGENRQLVTNDMVEFEK